jgi:hypothetical protein
MDGVRDLETTSHRGLKNPVNNLDIIREMQNVLLSDEMKIKVNLYQRLKQLFKNYYYYYYYYYYFYYDLVEL